jgi:translation initiation factor 4G
LHHEQPVAKRNSQQGKAKTNKPVIHMTLSLKEDVKLRETENAWKPDRMKPPSANEEDTKTEVCMRNSFLVVPDAWK